MIARGFAASVAVAAALLIAAPVSAANTHVSAPQHQQHAKATVRQAKTRQRPSTDAQHPDAAQPAAQPNRTVIVGVGTLVMSRQREFRDIAMAPTG